MKPSSLRLIAVIALLLLLSARQGRAQDVATAPPNPRPQVHRGIGPRSWWEPNAVSARQVHPMMGRPNRAGGYEPGLPRGRRYYGGRYFGSFNNRFYGPQYGNF